MSYKINCKFHLVICTKRRQKIIHPSLFRWFLDKYQDHFAFSVVESNGQSDHIHLIIDMFVTYFPISKLVNIIKNDSCRYIHEELDPTFHWSGGYFIASFGAATEDTIKNYIDNQ